MSDKTPVDLAHYGRMIDHLPVTMRPFVARPLRAWPKLFWFERKQTEDLLSFLAGLDRDQFDSLFRRLRAVENKMGVEQWQDFNQTQSLQNSSLLARSPYYEEWRQAIQDIVDIAGKEPARVAERKNFKSKRRVVVIIHPATLPMGKESVWKNWPESGRAFSLPQRSRAEDIVSGFLLHRQARATSGPVRDLSLQPSSPEDVWIIDADSTLKDVLPAEGLKELTYLSYTRLNKFRDAFLHDLNWIQKDLADADAVLEKLRGRKIESLCPPELAAAPAAREFVRELFLSGNGSTVFSNAFVQWAASEAFRRARPSVLIARFGTRNRPKPFTSVAILEDQSKASPLPDVPDSEGSAVDAQMLARYIWLSASRFDEYENSICLCVAESVPSAFVIAPPSHSLFAQSQAITVDRLRSVLIDWLNEASDRD